MCTVLCTLIPMHHGNVMKYQKSFSMLNGISAQFKRFQSLKKKHKMHTEACLVGGYSYPPLFSVAPMMDWTDNHFRTLARLISRHAWLYTEMIVAETIVHQKDNLDRFLLFSQDQHPIVLQIGGSNLENLAKAAELANSYSYDEINLKLFSFSVYYSQHQFTFFYYNLVFCCQYVFSCGCPSGKVAGHGCFGARLMFNPKLVGDAMAAMSANSSVPVSVKCRIGVDNRDSYNELCDFIYTVASRSPTKHFIIHARKALLNGLSPAENRKVPPLKYEYYFALQRDFPELQFTLNGGITCIHQVDSAIKEGASGVMVGRAAYNNPWHVLGHVDRVIYGVLSKSHSRRQILKKYQGYADSVIGRYGSNRPNIRQLVKPLLNLFHSEPGNGQWKRIADTALRHCKTMKSFLAETIAALPDSVLDSTLGNTPSSLEVPPFADLNSLLPPPYRSNA